MNYSEDWSSGIMESGSGCTINKSLKKASFIFLLYKYLDNFLHVYFISQSISRCFTLFIFRPTFYKERDEYLI